MAFSFYMKANDGRIPYAFIDYNDKNHSTWDTLISPFLRTTSRGTNSNTPALSEKAVLRTLLCPSDEIQPAPWAIGMYRRRTYAMPWHNMYPQNWPPGSNNETGVGLWWANFGGTNSNLEALNKQKQRIFISREMIHEPASTLLLAEHARASNIAGNSSGAVIKSASRHLDTSRIPTRLYHDGKFNYLQMDGHVDTLFPNQTVGHLGTVSPNPATQFGMWTIKSGD